MRFHQPVTLLLSNGNTTSSTISSSTAATITATATTNNGNSNHLSAALLIENDSTYFDEDNTNVTISVKSDLVTFSRNQNYNLLKYKETVEAPGKITTTETETETENNYLLSNNNKLNNINETFYSINDNEKIYATNNRNIVNNCNRAHLNENEVTKINIISCNKSNNETNNGNRINFGCRDNLNKLDLETNRRHNIEGGDGGRGGGNRLSICSESSPDDSFMEEEDGLSPTPSSCASLSSPEPNYPRGIINPNYPGFQHLAHTLSEHFTDHHFEHSSDSDISEEFEIELNGCDYLSNNLNNNNNNNFFTSNIHSDNGNENKLNTEEHNINLLLKSEPKIFCEEKKLSLPVEIKVPSLSSRDDEDNVNHENEGKIFNQSPSIDGETLSSDLCSGDEETIVETTHRQILNEEEDERTNIDEKMKDFYYGEPETINCNLATYLKQYETSSDIQNIMDDEFDSNCSITENSGEIKELATPDILLKNENQHQNSELELFNKFSVADFQPDLLRNIDNYAVKDITQNDATANPDSETGDGIQTKNQNHLHIIQNKGDGKDERKEIGISNVKPNYINDDDECGIENDDKKESVAIHCKTTLELNKKNVNDKKEGDSMIQVNAIDLIKTISPVTKRIAVTKPKTPPPPPPLPPPPSLIPSAEMVAPTATTITRGAAAIWSPTPVDIVGDFGEEIEREIGLIVSGYKNTNESIEQAAEEIENKKGIDDVIKEASDEIHEAQSTFSRGDYDIGCTGTDNSAAIGAKMASDLKSTLMLSKMTDAALSNGTETIAFSSIVENVRRDRIAVFSTSAPLDVPLNINEEEIKSTSSVFDCGSTITTTNSVKSLPSVRQNILPTAIVKPKYQKSSYDDRQLPPVGRIDLDRPWYVTQNVNNNLINKSGTVVSVSSTPKTEQYKIEQLPHFERKSTKRLLGSVSKSSHQHPHNNVTGSVIVVSAKEVLNSLRQCEKDIDCSSIAVVTPRKKDKMETKTLLINDVTESKQQPQQQLLKKNTTSIMQHSLCSDNNNHNSNNHHNNNNNNNINNNKNKNNNNINNGCNNNNTFNKGGSTNGQYKIAEKEKRKISKELSAGFDVYNIETALPVIDLEAIENHLKAAKEEERRRRTDREEIRRRLAMGAEDDYFNKVTSDKPGRKPSLQSRLQSGMNLQICFMNETASDTESPSSDSESCPKLSKASIIGNHKGMTNNGAAGATHYHSYSNPYSSRPLSMSVKKLSSSSISSHGGSSHSVGHSKARPSTLSLGPPLLENQDGDFFTRQARLQIEARMALAQAKDMAHMQMEIERQRQKQSPITEMIRNSLEKVGIALPPEKRRVSRQMLTDMNIAQLQIIVNELHTQIEYLNESLVRYLMERDELHMSQDSMLVDIEDLTRYLTHDRGAKEQSRLKSTDKQQHKPSPSSTTNLSSSRQKCIGTTKMSSLSRSSSSISSLTSTTSSTISQIFPSSNKLTSPTSIGSTTATTTVTATAVATQQPQTQSKFLRIANLVKK